MSQYKTVAELLEVPERWTKEQLARDAGGLACEPDSDSAKCWCLMGAIWHVCRTSNDGFTMEQKLIRSIGGVPLQLWNDAPERTHQEVLQACIKAGI